MSTIRIARGIRLDSAHADDLAFRCVTVLGAMPPSTVMSGFTAARLHGLWLPPHAVTARLDVTVVAMERASRLVSRPQHSAFVVHRRRVAPDDIVAVEGVPTTSIARTWRDLATLLPLADLVAMGDSALRLGAALEELAMQCQDVRGRPGARSATAALPLLDARSRSRPESHMRVALVHRDLPAFAVNQAVFDDFGQWLAEPDLSLAAARLALEYQGSDHADPERMRKDMTRVTELRRAGWEVLLYGPAEVLRRPQFIAVEVRDILRRRAPHVLLRHS